MADPIVDWAWRTPSLRTLLRTFDVHDPASQRTVMVFVFPSVEAAGLFRSTLATDEETNRPDPLLVTGYGPSVWRGNVAMVESTETNLARDAQLQADQDTGIYADRSGGPDPREAAEEMADTLARPITPGTRVLSKTLISCGRCHSVNSKGHMPPRLDALRG